MPTSESGIPDLDLTALMPDLMGQQPGMTGCEEARVVHSLPNGTVARFARFSPDSRSLVMQVAPASGETTGQLVLMSPCTGQMASLVGNAPQQSAPVFSPEGDRIYFTWGHTTEDSSIRMIGPSGGNVTSIADVFGAMMPDVSPDGKAMVFRINGGTFRSMPTDGRTAPSEVPFAGYSPRFSPDGSTLVFTEPHGSRMTVMLLDLASGEAKELATLDVSSTYFAGVDFTANGDGVVVTSDVGTELIGFDGSRAPIDDASGWVDVSPDGHVAVIVDRSKIVVLTDVI